MSLADNIKKRRLELNLSQEELAKRAGYKAKSSIARIESGKSDVNSSKLNALCHALDISAEDLLGASTPSKNESRTSKTIVIIQAGGKSTRNMMNVPNQFINVNDKPIIAYVMEAYEKHPEIDDIYISCLSGWESIVKSYAKKFNISKLRSIITGGDTILKSTKNALESIPNLDINNRVILQESTRPLINLSLISKLISHYEKNGNSVVVKPMRDYVLLSETDSSLNYIDRNLVMDLESPEIYSVKDLKHLIALVFPNNDDGSAISKLMYQSGIKFKLLKSDSINLKIIRQEDVYTFKTLKEVLL